MMQYLYLLFGVAFCGWIFGFVLPYLINAESNFLVLFGIVIMFVVMPVFLWAFFKNFFKIF